MLRKQITGAKYNSEQTGQMTNLNVAIPADSNDTDFGTSDVLLAKDTFKAVENKLTDKVVDVIKNGTDNTIVSAYQADGTPFTFETDIDFETGDELNIELVINHDGGKQEQVVAIGDRIDVWGASDGSNATVLHIYATNSDLVQVVKPILNIDYVSNNSVVKQGAMTTQGRKIAIKISKTVFSINGIVIKNYDLTKLLSLKHIKIGSAFKGEPKKLSTCTYDKIYIHNDLIKTTDIKVPTKISELTNDAGYVKNDALVWTSGTGDGSAITVISKNANGSDTSLGAIGKGSCAHGGYTTAKGMFSHAEGHRTWAESTNSHAEGQYNSIDPYAIQSVGIGDANKRKTAEFIYLNPIYSDKKNGNMYLIGVGDYDGSSYSSKYKSVQEVIADLTARITALEAKNTTA